MWHSQPDREKGFLRSLESEGGTSRHKSPLGILPAMQEMQVQSLGLEDPLEEEGRATHSRILARRTPQTEEPGGYSPRGRTESDATAVTSTGFSGGTPPYVK